MNFKSPYLKPIFSLIVFALFLASCGSAKPVATSSKNTNIAKSKTVARAEGLRNLDSGFSGKITSDIQKLLKDAQKYIGTPYKYGGSTPKGFDCSGFTFTVFEQNAFVLPRRSSDQALTGDKIPVRQVKPGDLLFFATAGGNRVSHVGIVQEIGSNGEVKFIHASTSRGVIISSLNEKYWNKAYLHATRVL